MNKSLNINVSSGTVAIGATSQGDHVNIEGQASVTQEQAEQHYQVAEQALRKLALEYEKTGSEIQDALAQIAALKSEATSSTKDSNKGNAILKVARDNFSWAYPAIKDFAKAVWPLLIVAVGT